jgi:hypothetical protein
VIVSLSLPLDAIVHIVDIAIVVWIIHTIRLSSFRDGAMMKMAGHQPNVPIRPVTIPIHVEDSLIVQAIATALAIEQLAVADTLTPPAATILWRV